MSDNQLTPIDSESVREDLTRILADYFKRYPHVSLNALAKKCRISEPTLRRLYRGQIKTLPTETTIVDILSVISKKSGIKELIDTYPGPIANYLKQTFGVFDNCGGNYTYRPELSEALKDPTRYLIYKLAANSRGVSKRKVLELFGAHSEAHLNEMVSSTLLYESGGFYHTKSEGFSLGLDHFVDHFKLTANFIKTAPHPGGVKDNLFYNASNSVNAHGREKILTIARKAMSEIVKVLNDPNYDGNIPLFILNAVDSLDVKRASDSDFS